MKPRIAIPIPHSFKPEYAQRSLPQYTAAVEASGGEAVVIPLDKDPDETMKLIESCDAVLLPGSAADVDPQKYGAAERHTKTASPDPKRDTVDELLLQDAYNLHKPVLGICYGLQMLNVYCSGTLVQDIDSRVNHAAGREVPLAHKVRVDPVSRFASYIKQAARNGSEIMVNSSHHQAADVIGDGLRVVARCPEDNLVEAVEGTSPEHWVLAVQWHPERSYGDDAPSKAIFNAFVKAAEEHARSR
jgi:putative glutamine amidotransferase